MDLTIQNLEDLINYLKVNREVTMVTLIDTDRNEIIYWDKHECHKRRISKLYEEMLDEQAFA